MVVGGFVVPEDCFNSIVDADENGDGAITAQEFVTFASTYTETSLGSSFADLPAAFIATFNRLAWDCSSCTKEDDPECCQANGSLDVPDSVSEVDYDLCRSTSNAANATPSPTRTPTIMPTAAPTTAMPTAAPITPAPQIVPTTPVPTDVPTMAPTSGAPTTAPTSVETMSLAYDIVIRDGVTLFDGPDRDAFTNEYQANLLNAVNDIVEAAIDVTRRRRRRYLAVSIVQPATISLTELDACPTDTRYAPTDTDICERVEHEVQVRVADTEEATSAQMASTEALKNELQLALDNREWSNVVDNTNPLIVLSFLGRGRRLRGGGIGGIAAAAALTLLIPAAYLLYRRKQANDAKKEDEPVDNDDDDDEEMGASMDTSTDPMITNTGSTLGATNPDYGKGDVLAEPGLLDGDDASSNAGSSGWSSSAGISSLNTGSMDEEGATLTGIGVASAFSRNLGEETDDSETPSRDQLDALIESGDWAAVGATAALLAAASDSQSERSSKVDSTAGDNENVAELDDLVDAGDWEGVVAAAAKFEASAGTGSQSRTTSNSMESTGTGQSTLSNSAGDTPSKVQKREEVRAEVEALVRRVVPDEIDNVDEMMNQFKGREEELVETLRTMQERAVAQKARSAGHKAAKQEARRNVQRGVVPGKSSVIKKVTKLEIQEASAGSGGKQRAGQGMSDAAYLKENPRSALEEAIEAGDWEAVGEAAAMISDSSVTTASTAEIQRLAGTNLSISTSGTSRSSRANMSGVQAERAVELDQLIDSGDWTAVMAAAKGYSETDRKDAAAGSRSKEEEEALKEAEHWMKIAEKTKGSNTGASDAAEWAIQRSLTQLKKADKKSEAKSGEDEV